MIDARHHQLVHRMLRGVLIVMVLVALVWAVMPDRAETSGFDIDAFTRVEPASSTSLASSEPFDPGVFQTTLWYEPPASEPKAPPRPAPSPRLTLELMAISMEAIPGAQPVRVAVVYDTQDDTVHTLRVGDRYGDAVIESISDEGVEIRVGTRTMRLKLELAG